MSITFVQYVLKKIDKLNFFQVDTKLNVEMSQYTHTLISLYHSI